MSLSRDLRFSVRYWREAYELLARQTGRDLNDGLGLDPRVAAARERRGQAPDPADARDSASPRQVES